VLVDLLCESPAPVVTFDNFAGISSAFEHLYALGHRSFGYLGGSQKAVAYQERLAAFRCKLAEKQLKAREDWIYTGSNHMVAVSAWAEGMLLKEKPTAFLCANDFMAIALMKTAQTKGFAIPRDFSVLGYDDIDPAALVSPALSSMRVPTFESGQVAVQQLSLQIKLGNRRARRGAVVRLQPELVLRESTAAPVRPSQALLNAIK
jgi:DNA-binding LacI/PurR family transcriptional regulator